MTLRALVESVASAWDVANPCELYYGKLPEGAELPAAAFQVVSVNPYEPGMHAVPESALVQFSVYSDDEAVGECMDIRDVIRATFDSLTMDVGGATVVRLDWENDVGPMPDPDEGWDCHIDYRFVTQSV